MQSVLRSLTRRVTFGFATAAKPVSSVPTTQTDLPAPAIKQRMVFEYDPQTAVRLVKAYSTRAFTESVDLTLKLGINPKRSEQNLRGSCVLPGGLSRSKKICFFGANATEEEVAKQAGADLIGNDAILEEIKKEKFSFDQIYCSTTGINKLKPYARILGPKGLFPNVKVKTLFPPEEIGALTRDPDPRGEDR